MRTDQRREMGMTAIMRSVVTSRATSVMVKAKARLRMLGRTQVAGSRESA